MGSRPQSPRLSLQEVKDLGEDLVLQAREQVVMLTGGARSENIWSEVTGQLSQQLEQACSDCRQRNVNECSSDLPEEYVWPPKTPGVAIRHEIRGQPTLLEAYDQDGVPGYMQSFLDIGFPRKRCVEARQAVGYSLDAAIDYLLNNPLPSL